ncbi:hypothetical protein [uncultured Dokdonia sp.]|nr:hypothetical protein [uncultured Dokdonia sp.]
MKKEKTKLPLEKFTVANLAQDKVFGGNANQSVVDTKNSSIPCADEF